MIEWFFFLTIRSFSHSVIVTPPTRYFTILREEMKKNSIRNEFLINLIRVFWNLIMHKSDSFMKFVIIINDFLSELSQKCTRKGDQRDKRKLYLLFIFVDYYLKILFNDIFLVSLSSFKFYALCKQIIFFLRWRTQWEKRGKVLWD